MFSTFKLTSITILNCLLSFGRKNTFGEISSSIGCSFGIYKPVDLNTTIGNPTPKNSNLFCSVVSISRCLIKFRFSNFSAQWRIIVYGFEMTINKWFLTKAF